MAELEYWQMWHERCALKLCTETAQYDLQGFAYDRFRQYLQKLSKSIPAPQASDAWHAFESHLALGKKRSTKTWKKWLFARAGSPATLNCIQGGATLIMRDVVRQYLRREYSPAWLTSLDASVQQTGQPNASGETRISLGDLLPDNTSPIEAIENNECRELAMKLYPEIFDSLSHRENIALVTHCAGKTLSHPSVAKAGNCGKSSLCNALHQGSQKIAETLKHALPAESSQVLMLIAGQILDRIHKKMLPILEKEHPQFFMYVTEE